MKKLLLILLILPAFCGVCHAEGVDDEIAHSTNIEQMENALEEEEYGIAGDFEPDGSFDTKGALSRLWDRLVQSAQDQIKNEVRLFAVLLGIALMGGLAGSLCSDKRMTGYVETASCCCAALLVAGGVEGVVAQATASLQRLYEYANAALPAFFAAVAASGAAVSASVKYAAACFAMEVFMTISQRWILPLIYAFIAVSVCGCLFENAILSAAARATKWCVISAMTGFTTAFCLFINLSGAIAGSADAAAVKTTKTLIASSLPVVGGILSDSASAILSAAAVIKNSSGVFGLIAVCAICAGPFAVLSVKMLFYKACSALSELSCGGRYAKMLNSMGTGFAMLLGLVGCYGIMLFFSFMSGVHMVTA